MKWRVANGMRRLNRFHPDGPGWVEHIDLERLDIKHDYVCMLGQLFASYLAGTIALGFKYIATPVWRFEYVLMGVWRCGFKYDPEEDIHELNACWREAILGRLSARRRAGIYPASFLPVPEEHICFLGPTTRPEAPDKHHVQVFVQDPSVAFDAKQMLAAALARGNARERALAD